MSDDQNPLERAVDLLVYAPLGVAMFAKDTVPTFLKMFVSRGQTELARQKKSLHDHANQYRAVGKFAVKYGSPEVKRQAGSKLDGARRLAEETISGLVPAMGGGGAEEPAVATPRPAPKTAPKVKDAPKDGGDARSTNGSSNGKSATTKPAAAATPHVAPTLAIPGYDQLSASQVVERLDGLTPGELDAVREYEVAHRGRNTILGKITQLTTS